MKKFIFGILIGLAMSFPLATQAEEIKSLIGKVIEGQFAVKLDGKQLDNQAIVIDGTSYLPVRAISEALGMDVKFDADLGIELNAKEGQPVSATSSLQMSQEDIEKIANAEASIQRAQSFVPDLESGLAALRTRYASETDRYQLQILKSEIDAKQLTLDGYLQGISMLQASVAKIKAKYE